MTSFSTPPFYSFYSIHYNNNEYLLRKIIFNVHKFFSRRPPLSKIDYLRPPFFQFYFIFFWRSTLFTNSFALLLIYLTSYLLRPPFLFIYNYYEKTFYLHTKYFFLFRNVLFQLEALYFSFFLTHIQQMLLYFLFWKALLLYLI